MARRWLAQCVPLLPFFAELPTLLLTPFAWAPVGDELNELGIRHWRPRPLVLQQLLPLIADLLRSGTDTEADSSSSTTVALATVEARTSFDGKRVLVAEDNHVNQVVVSRMLDKLGLAYDLVSHGREALDRLQTNYQAYDLVLMDCEMPVMNGFDATRALRQQETKLYRERKPVIALTAHVLKEFRQQARDMGMDDVLGKPLEYRALESMLLAYLREGGQAG